MESKKSKWARRAALPLAFALAAAVLAGCAPAASNASEQDPDAQILVWGDATRKPAFDLYKKANPEANFKFELIDAASYLSKIQLANKVGSGWPDLIFAGDPNVVAALSSPLFNYAQPLDDLVPQDVQKNFAGENAWCTIDGKLYCLQNDLAQGVLWYNKPLLEEYGYELPKTWDEYAALGAKAAAEHPGTIVGSANAAFYDFLWSSGCPLQRLKSSTEAVINTADEKCTRVAETLDPMMENGSLSRAAIWGKDFVDIAKAGNLLMLPGPSWVGPIFLKNPDLVGAADGTWAAGAEPTWEGEDTNWSGATGGGVYIVSSHSKNTAAAVAAAQWLTTADDYQATAQTFPAYVPAAKAWLKNVAADPWFATDPSEVFADQAAKINPGTSPTRYDAVSAYNATVGTAITNGQSIASALPALQTQLSSLAANAGYAVTDK